MTLFETIAMLISLAALFSFINERFVRLPTAISLMLIALLMSFGLMLLDHWGWGIAAQARMLLDHIDFRGPLKTPADLR